MCQQMIYRTVALSNCLYSGRVCTVSYVTGCDLLGKHCPIWTSDCRSDWWPQNMDIATASQPLGSEPTSHHLIQPSPLAFAGVCLTLSKIIPTEYKHMFRFLNPTRKKKQILPSDRTIVIKDPEATFSKNYVVRFQHTCVWFGLDVGQQTLTLSNSCSNFSVRMRRLSTVHKQNRRRSRS
jgi:hypothetical protein